MASIAPTRDAPPAAPAAQLTRGGRPGAEGGWWIYLLLVLGLILLIGPFIWMLLGSVKTPGEFLQLPPTWLPQAPTLDNFQRLFGLLDFPRFFTNSLIVAGVVTVGNIVFCSMLGWALAKLRFRGKNGLFLLVLATLMVPGTVIIVPLFVLVAGLNIDNSYAGLTLPFLAGPFGVFLMRQFMLGIPDELIDAARVDGAGEYFIFWRIAMPLATPAIATLGILTFLAAWNAFLWPSIVATNQEMYTLPVALTTYSNGQYQADYGLLMAGAVVIVGPILLVFVLLQRYFTQGIAMTGIKG